MKQMLQFLSCLFFFCMITMFGHAQTVHYVDPSATGNNDGTSWDNAFTDLQTPLSAASEGDEIWVVSGTYTPSPNDLDRTVSFELNNRVSIYGGFAGTETSIDERDLSANVTILSGDNALNDGDDPDDAALMDNAYNILNASLMSANGTTIDGVTFEHASGVLVENIVMDTITTDSVVIDTVFDEAGKLSRGGAIYSTIALNIINCTFQDNFTYRGGAIYWETMMEGSSISNSTFENNESRRGGALFLDSVQVDFENVTFINNRAITLFEDGGFGGAIYTLDATSTYTNNQFENNSSSDDGGAIWGFGNTDRFADCLFESNLSGDRGGAIYFVESEAYYNNVQFLENNAEDDAGVMWVSGVNDSFIDCEFRLNTAADRSGAIYADDRDIDTIEDVNGDHIYINCTFEANVAEDDGGVIMSSAGIGSLQFYNSEFLNNSGADNGGVLFIGFRESNDHLIHMQGCRFSGNIGDDGGVINLQRNVMLNIDNCTFSNNEASDDGGVLTAGFASFYKSIIINISNSTFSGNQSADGGAAIDIFSDSIELNLVNVNFISNSTSEGSGGAIQISGHHDVTIDSCNFESNISTTVNDDGAGGAISAEGDNTTVFGRYPNLHISKCSFIGNSAKSQGAALNLSTFNTTVVNSVFAYNQSDVRGYGTIMNVGGTDTTRLTLINNSFAYNEAAVTAGVAQIATPGSDSIEATYAETHLLNNIFYNPGTPNYAVEGGRPAVISWGGNMYHDNTLSTLDDHPVVFFDIANPYAGDFEYFIQDTAFAANKGVNVVGLTPETDITGATRITPMDTLITAGAFEVFLEDDNSLNNQLQSSFELELWPNITSDLIHLQFENADRGNVKVMVFDASGKVVFQMDEEKGSEVFQRSYNLGQLQSGMYLIRTVSENEVGGARFMVKK